MTGRNDDAHAGAAAALTFGWLIPMTAVCALTLAVAVVARSASAGAIAGVLAWGATVLVIDAKEGVRENSRRHGYILAMLGIRQVVVCVNKMDLVGYDRAHFEVIEKEYRAFLASIGAVTPRFGRERVA